MRVLPKLKLFLVVAAGVCIVCLAAVAILAFGNPQWSKHIYMFQCYVFPGAKDETILPPGNYTGPWRTWNRDGHLIWSGNILHGAIDGKVLTWDDDGNLLAYQMFSGGKLDGLMTTFFPSGAIHEVIRYTRGRQDGMNLRWYENGQLEWQETYKDGIGRYVQVLVSIRRVTARGELAACSRRGGGHEVYSVLRRRKQGGGWPIGTANAGESDTSCRHMVLLG